LTQNTIEKDLENISKIDVVPKILEVVCRTTKMGFAAVARVTEDRWVACAVRDEIQFGLEPGGELQIRTTICDEIRKSGEGVVIDYVSEDMNFCRHPTPKMYGFQSYISIPIIRSNGEFFGTLCAIDPQPARLNTPETVGMFKLFTELIALHLDTQEQLQVSEKALLDERETAQLREQFVAILGHDLRSPLNAIRAGAEVLDLVSMPEDAKPVVGIIKRSAVRMNGLIENVMDFARARLGGGLSLSRAANTELNAALEQVISEMRIAWPERAMKSEITLSRPVFCDAPRIAQLLSNLIANAITHGAAGSPVSVFARSNEDGFELSVSNQGEPIPPQALERLFQPYQRASDRPGQQGLGLGLYIASEIAREHEGSLEVESSVKETRFVFRMPVKR
jgi:signal transduction histidine kinase